MAKEVVYDKVAVKVHEGDKALTVAEAKTLIGYETPAKGKDFEAGTYLFRDLEKSKVKLAKSPTNRPFRMVLAKKYMLEILRGKWELNGENIVIDRLGHVQSGQHRLVGFILAEQERQLRPKHWAEHGVKGPLTLECTVCTGISEKKEVADTLDTGQKRSLGDVVFRRHEFKVAKGEDSSTKRLASILAGAIRLVWLRMSGQTVSDAPHFPHSEALEFLEAHPKIKDCVSFIWSCEGGKGAEGKQVSSQLSLAYAAGMMYLMASAKSDINGDKKGAIKFDFSLMDKAEKFWTLFASGANLKENDPILTLQKALKRADASGAKGRDIILGMIAKAWNAWVEGEKLEAKDIRIKETIDKTTERRVLAEHPRVGGLDVDREPISLEESGGWSVGDKCWVNDEGGSHWSGLITGFEDADNAEVLPDPKFRDDESDGNEIWVIAVEDLRDSEPATEEVDEKEAA